MPEPLIDDARSSAPRTLPSSRQRLYRAIAENKKNCKEEPGRGVVKNAPEIHYFAANASRLEDMMTEGRSLRLFNLICAYVCVPSAYFTCCPRNIPPCCVHVIITRVDSFLAAQQIEPTDNATPEIAACLMEGAKDRAEGSSFIMKDGLVCATPILVRVIAQIRADQGTRGCS